MSAQDETKEIRRREALEAAKEIILDGGHRALTFGAVADRMGLARNSLYEYYPSRDSLIEAVFVTWIPEATGILYDSITSAQTAEDLVEVVIRNGIACDRRFRFRISAVLRDTEFANGPITETFDEIAKKLGIELERVGVTSTSEVLVMLQAIIFHVCSLLELGSDESIVNEAVRFTQHGVAAFVTK